MGNTLEVMRVLRHEHVRIFEILRLLRNEMNSFQTRLAGLEKDYENVETSLRENNYQMEKNSNDLLNLHLLEEGRSTYRPKYTKKYHTASTYK